MFHCSLKLQTLFICSPKLNFLNSWEAPYKYKNSFYVDKNNIDNNISRAFSDYMYFFIDC